MAARGSRAHQVLAFDPVRRAPLPTLVKLAKQLWTIERDYTLCIAAYGFLVAERNRFSPSARAGHLGLPKPEIPPDFQPRGSPPSSRAA